MDTLTPVERSIRMGLVRSKDTKPEMRVRRLVHSLGYRYRLHVTSLPGRPDLVFPSRRKIILVHGCFWHQHDCKLGARMPKSRLDFWSTKLKSNQARDRKQILTLKRDGWQVLVVWECQTLGQAADRLGKRITRFLKQARLG